MIVISDVYNKYIISEKYTKIQAIKFSMFQNEGVLSLSWGYINEWQGEHQGEWFNKSLEGKLKPINRDIRPEP